MVSEQHAVVVVDDDPSVLAALRRLITSNGHRVRTFSSGRDLLDDPTWPDAGCLVLDLSMPDQTGLELQAELARRGNRVPIVFLSGVGTVPTSVRAMQGGAVDFLEKPPNEDQLMGAVERALARGAAERKRRERSARLEERLELLTSREREVFELVVSGSMNKQIARKLGVTEGTIKVHRGRVMEKLGAQSLAHLVRIAERLGVFPEPG